MILWGLFDDREQLAGLDRGVLLNQQLVYPAGHARDDRGLHLHGLDHEQHLVLLDHVALPHQHAGHHARHGRSGLRLVSRVGQFNVFVQLGRLRVWYSDLAAHAVELEQHGARAVLVAVAEA